MTRTVFEKLEQDNISYRNTFVTPQYPPMPEEVLGWDIGLQELFCILSTTHHSDGRSFEEADSLAIEQVKESEWFALWGTKSQ